MKQGWGIVAFTSDTGSQVPAVQSIVSLTGSLVVKMLTVLVSTISNAQVFLLKKIEKQMQKLHIFFSNDNSVYAIFNDQSFNDTLPNDIVSFEQMGPDVSSTTDGPNKDKTSDINPPMKIWMGTIIEWDPIYRKRRIIAINHDWVEN